MLTKQQQTIIKEIASMIMEPHFSITGYSIAQRLNMNVGTVYRQLKKINEMEIL
jgi:predicted transcriptional regulator